MPIVFATVGKNPVEEMGVTGAVGEEMGSKDAAWDPLQSQSPGS